MKTQLFAIFLFLAFLMSLSGKRIPSFAGPYVVRIRRVTNISDVYKATTDHLQFKVMVTHPARLNQLQYGWGFFRLTDDFDDEHQMKMFVSKWSNNKWVPNAFVMDFKKGCTAALAYGKDVVNAFFGTGFNSCPLKKVDREVPNHTVSVNFPTVPIFPYGRWLATAVWYKHGALTCTMVTDLDILPKL